MPLQCFDGQRWPRAETQGWSRGASPGDGWGRSEFHCAVPAAGARILRCCRCGCIAVERVACGAGGSGGEQVSGYGLASLLAGWDRRGSGSTLTENSWNAIGRRRQGRESCVRPGLIPVGCRIKIVGAMVGVAVFDGHLDRLFKGDGALDVPAVKAVAATDPLMRIRDLRCAVVLV